MRRKASKKKRPAIVPTNLLRKMGLRDGESLDYKLEGGRIIVTPKRKSKRKFKPRIIKDPITGLPVLDTGPDSPILTSERVAELLSDFP
jgi:hypothetical protein